MVRAQLQEEAVSTGSESGFRGEWVCFCLTLRGQAVSPAPLLLKAIFPEQEVIIILHYNKWVLAFTFL